MSFTPQQKIPLTDVRILNYSAPASIVFKDKLYVFYVGYNDDGIW